MQFSQTRLIYSTGSGGGNFADLPLSKLVPENAYASAVTVKTYCAWLDQMGADYEVRSDRVSGFLLVKSNLQELPRLEPVEVKSGIKRRSKLSAV